MRNTRIGDAPTRPAGRSLSIGLVVLAAACAELGDESPAAGQGEVAVRSLAAAIEAADTALIVDLFWPHASYDDFAAQHSYEGIDEIVGYLTEPHVWGDDVYKNVGRVHVTERGAVAEWVFSAVQNRPLGDLAPQGTGREVVLSGVTILEMENGRIIRAADYVDTQPLLLQLGARIELPGGRVIEQPAPRPDP